MLLGQGSKLRDCPSHSRTIGTNDIHTEYAYIITVNYTVRVPSFTGYKILRFLQIVLHLRNLILGYICARDLKIRVCAHLQNYHTRSNYLNVLITQMVYLIVLFLPNSLNTILSFTLSL